MTHDIAPFDLYGPLPTGTTVLEASAGTGKTYTVAALVTRYVAEGHARLEEMLVITFGRAASRELRERVREQLAETERALADPDAARAGGGLSGFIAEVDDDEVAERRRRIQAALSSYDAATIATTHQFCHLVLRSLGVGGETEAHTRMVDDLDKLVGDVVDDLYLARYGGEADPPLARSLLAEISRAAVRDPQAVVADADASDTSAQRRVSFVRDVRAELKRRKRHLGLLSYDDLLTRLATALEEEGSPARERMRERWKVVLVDEFQDTDPVQWAVLDRAFNGVATMILIGDPKQAIYAFRGGDIVTYLAAADAVGASGRTLTLDTNWRSDRPLVDALGHLLGGTTLGDPRIVVHPVAAAATNQESRLRGAPAGDPFRVRMLTAADLGAGPAGTVPVGDARARIAADLADDVALLLGSGATYDGEPIGAGDIAVLMYSVLGAAQPFRDALAERGIPSVVSGGASVLTSPAAEQWLTLLEALEQPHRPQRVRAVGLTAFVGLRAAELDAGGERLTDDLAEEVRGWLDIFRARGVAGVYAAITASGLVEREFSHPDGERLLTDLSHLAQLLHDHAHRERLGISALLGWFRAERRSVTRQDTRVRRLDVDARAIQFTTIHASKGLQYPVVYLPVAFNRWVSSGGPTALYHDNGVRTLDVTGGHADLARTEAAAEELRLTYVALTRAKSQVVTWVAPTRDSTTAGLSRMLLGREPGKPIPDAFITGAPAEETWARLTAWQDAGAIRAERITPRTVPPLSAAVDIPQLTARIFDRAIDTTWRRTSYSGLIRTADQAASHVAESEPEVLGTVDEPEQDEPAGATPTVDAEVVGLASPMADLPAGAAFGSLVHGVLEHADPNAADLRAELATHAADQADWWGVNVSAEVLAEALLPMQRTPLGPVADDLCLVDIGRGDRLCELDFEIPLAGGDAADGATVLLGQMADVLRSHLAADDPLIAYADRLEAPGLGDQVLRGYLSGSIDVVLRVPDPRAGHRFVVVDYKTNRLGHSDRLLTTADYTQPLMAEAMMHSHYPLQALLYSVVLHRYLRWRLPDYDPGRHLGGVLYLYVRGMAGPDTPYVDGVPCGVFTWQPPAAMIVALSDLLAGNGNGNGNGNGTDAARGGDGDE